jgi:hypothetical protein
MVLGFLGLSVNWWLIILIAVFIAFIIIYISRNKIYNYIIKKKVSKGDEVRLGVSGPNGPSDVNKGQSEQIWKRLEAHENRFDAMVKIQNETDANISKLHQKINKE